jgi:hypothetical protein
MCNDGTISIELTLQVEGLEFEPWNILDRTKNKNKQLKLWPRLKA